LNKFMWMTTRGICNSRRLDMWDSVGEIWQNIFPNLATRTQQSTEKVTRWKNGPLFYIEKSKTESKSEQVSINWKQNFSRKI